MRLRLKASYDISSFPPQAKAILAGLQQYGMIMADNGSSMFLSGDPDVRWSNNDLNTRKQVPASAFEVVLMNPIYTPGNVPQGNAPVINTFTANPSSISPGQTATLNWSSNGASYFVVSPQVGAIRGTTVTVTPTQTTSYILYATNAYGRSRATVSVTVH